MSLVYEVGYDNVSNIGNLEVKFKEWTAKDERKYLQLVEKEGNELTDKMVYDVLIKPCVENKDLVLSASQQKKLLIDIRIKSIGDEFTDIIECSNCEAKNTVDINISDIMKYKEANFKEVKIDNLVFNMGPIKSNDDKDKLKIEDGIVQYVFTDFLLHINSIEIDGELHEKFSFRELHKFVDKLPTRIFDELFEEYQKMIDVLDLDYNFVCSSCSEEEVKDYTYIPNLLWI